MTQKNPCFLALLNLLLLVSVTSAQEIPKKDATIHYTQVYFEDGFNSIALKYQLHLYSDSLKTLLVATKSNTLPSFWIENLKWGTSYWWSMTSYGKSSGDSTQSALRHFKIRKKMTALNLRDSKLDLRINKTDKNAGGLIILDYARSIIDRSGQQLWSIPEFDAKNSDRKQVRDLKVTKDNTITFLGGNIPIEMDFEGNILWQGPSPFLMGKDTIHYHHDFRKGTNGHYYVLGNKKVKRRVTGTYSDSLLRTEVNIVRQQDSIYKRTLHGLLLEFDEKGNLVWFWDSNLYISDEDLSYKKNQSGLPIFGTHMNAFSINKDNTKAYVGFRDLNRIVRVDKKTKKVEFSYGEKYPSGEATAEFEFKGQHDATITNQKTILVFNNNNGQPNNPGPASVMEIKDVSFEKDKKTLWKFDMKFDSLADGKSSAGGNVVELPNGNYLICGGVLPRIIEVTKNKEVVWDAFTYGQGLTDSLWSPFAQYRSNWTSQLFYYHFLAKLVGTTVNIFNTGNVADEYLIEFENSKKEKIVVLKTNSIPPGGSSSFKIPASKKYVGQSLKISSTHNKPLSKIIHSEIK